MALTCQMKAFARRPDVKCLLILVPMLLLIVRNAIAGDFSTPEAALHEHQAAWAHRDINLFLSTISFKQEAVEILQGTAPKDAAPGDTEVNQLAARRENNLKEQLTRDGFKPDYLPTCKIIVKQQVSETIVKFPLSCSMSHGYIFFSIRLVHVDDGWRVVRH
jgi:hypothetical protein